MHIKDGTEQHVFEVKALGQFVLWLPLAVNREFINAFLIFVPLICTENERWVTRLNNNSRELGSLVLLIRSKYM